MKKNLFLGKSWLCWLVLSVFLVGSIFPPQTAQAAEPCSGWFWVHEYPITADETWVAGTHCLADHVTVVKGVTLTIAAGATLISGEEIGDKYLIIQGHLDVLGTAAQPVVMQRGPGTYRRWGGIFFDGSQGDGSGTINYATIEDAGSPYPPNNDPELQRAAVYVRHLSTGKQVTISNAIIRNNASQGLYVDDSTVNVTHTTFSQQQYPIVIEGAAAVVTYSGNTFSDNANPHYLSGNVILIAQNALMGHDFSLPAQTGLDAYVFMADSSTPGSSIIPAGRTMTVEPGVTVRMTGGEHLIVKGHLAAVGTQALPIRFTGVRTPDTLMHSWGGLIFDGPSGASGHLDHTIVEYGCRSWNANCATLMIYNLAADKSVVVEHSTLQESDSIVMAVINSPTAQVDGNLIKGGQYGAYLATNLTISNLAVTDQTLDGVYVESGYTVEARHLTIARTGHSGFYVNTGGTGLLKNSILSHNIMAVKAEGSGQAILGTNLSDANTTFKTGTVTEQHTINGSAAFAADGYHIQATSAAVGRGQAGLCTVDIDGTPRPSPSGSIPDLGADEILAGKFNFFVPRLAR